jgi:hypothetical protein
MKNIVSTWDKFFFEDRPTEGIALFRIVWIGLIFFYFLLDLSNIEFFYGPRAIISFETARSHFPFLQANLLNLFPPSYEAIYALMTVYGISLIFSLIGLFTRPSLVVALLCMTSLHQRNIWLLSSSEMLMRLITLYLVFSPCGHSLSLDSFLGRYYPKFKRSRTWPMWSWRLIQIQISVVYLWTFWHKINGDSWLDGSAVYYATRLENMNNSSLPMLMDSKIFLALMTWSTLVIEFSLASLIWIKEFRRPVIFLGVIFHLGIEYIMTIPFFELYMITLLINFYTPEEIRAFLENAKRVLSENIQIIRSANEPAN